MNLRLSQIRTPEGTRGVVAATARGAKRVANVTTIYELAQRALQESTTLSEIARSLLTNESIDLQRALDDGCVLAPIDHPDAAHLHLTGTGLTHRGSAKSRDKMHQAAASSAVTDSMRMFEMGLEGGKPANGLVGVQPEWFYKGDGSHICNPESPLTAPWFSLDGSEEPELAGIYLIGAGGEPYRLGYCLANEFSDHITERTNYLWLAHSKLRPAALGPELLTGEPPTDIHGTSRIRRAGDVLWEKPFLTGEANMSHSLSNLEFHHFKYGLFRRPGDVHVHFFGTATLSFADGIATREGDIFEIEAAPFLLPLRNPLRRSSSETVSVHSL